MLCYEFIDPEEQLHSEDFYTVESFLKMTNRTQIGWHYITDIVWIYSKAKHWSRDIRILDAGGGNGPLQFLLAEMGFRVTNIDLLLYNPDVECRVRYGTERRVLSSFVSTEYIPYLKGSFRHFLYDVYKRYFYSGLQAFPGYKNWRIKKCVATHDQWRSQFGLDNHPLGKIEWVMGNLCSVPEVDSKSFDAVVSLSALEHIPRDSLVFALQEIKRVLKPDAEWAVTTSGTHEAASWYHAPSQGYCFCERDLDSIFGAIELRSQKASDILEKYRLCDYLKDNLADFYKKSGKYGMPWGIWDPKYIPVGLFRT